MLYPIKISQLLEATGGMLISGSPDELIYSFSTDTRTLKKGDFFVAVKGENFDGHQFINQAIEKGAAGIIADKDITDARLTASARHAIIKVKNILDAYLDIAGVYLKNFKVKTVGITGSVGKTTTKEIVSYMLESKYKVLKPAGSFNNEIGIPKTIFELNDFHEILVLELAMRGKNQIARLGGIVHPQVGMVTNIGESHFEFMNSYEAIAQAKAELLEALPPGGLAVINNDDKFAGYLKSMAKSSVVTYAVENKADFKAENIINLGLDGQEFDVNIRNKERIKFKTTLLGRANILNITGALAIGFYFDIPENLLRLRVNDFQSPPGRMRKIILPNSVVLLDDCYNASPTSAKAALDAVKGLKINGKKIVVFGDMLELGSITYEAHHKTGACIAGSGVDFLIALGDNAQSLAKGASDSGFPEKDIFIAKDNNEAAKKLKEIISEGDLILFKGSRKMKLEEIEKKLEE